TYSWTIGTITGGITGATAGSGNINQILTNPNNSSAGTVEYIVTPTSTTGTCTGLPYSIIVTVNPSPVVTTPSAYTICSQTSTAIPLTATVPSTFNWTRTVSGGIAGSA